MLKISSEQLPPQNIDAEKSVLGSIIIDKDSINKVVDFLAPEDFYHPSHQIIYATAINLFEKRDPIDLLSLSNRLGEMGRLDEIGGITYLTSLTNSVPTSSHISTYGKIVQRKKMLRDLISAAHHISELGHNEEEDVEHLMDEAEQRIFSVAQRSLTQAFTHLGTGLNEAVERITNQDMGVLRGYPTKHKYLDNLLGGLQKSDLIILAARPSVGKTAFAIDLAGKVAEQGIPVGIFSLEMSVDQVVDRFIASKAGVSLWKLRTGKLSHDEDDFLRITTACDELKAMPIYVDDSSSPNILQIRAMARRLQANQGLGLLIVDYLQLMSSKRSYDSPVQQVTEISRGLKGLAKELNIPVVALSQLSRAVEQRDGHKPRLSDLRDSGCLTGDSLIMRADTGELVTIKSLVERKQQIPVPVFSLDKDLKLSIQPLTKAFSSGKKKIFELTLRSGRVIKASANHPFYKLDGWYSLDQLKPQDRIAIPRSFHPIKPINGLIDDELILLAHLLGDGCILPRQPFHYTSADGNNINIVEEIANRLFGIKPRIIKQKNWWHVYLPSPYHLTHNRKHSITNWFTELGIGLVRSYEKILPNKIFTQTNDKIALFIKHLWSTDGNISWKKLKGRLPSAAIYYSSTSRIMIEQLQHLFLRFGIQSTIRIIRKGSYRLNYQVHIQGSENQLKFLKQIGCYGDRGKIIPDLVRALEKIKPNINLDTVPKEAWRLMIAQARKEAQMSWRAMSSGLNVKYNGNALLSTGIGRERLMNLANLLESKLLNDLAQSDIYWDEIGSIKSLDTEEVYDATVAGTHNFIANDIIVHNSIEQDADVVMFIHREDKINFEKAKEQNKLNYAQLVVAKHRNGPTGEVDFRVNPESLRFLEVDKSRQEEVLTF